MPEDDLVRVLRRCLPPALSSTHAGRELATRQAARLREHFTSDEVMESVIWRLGHHVDYYRLLDALELVQKAPTPCPCGGAGEYPPSGGDDCPWCHGLGRSVGARQTSPHRVDDVAGDEPTRRRSS